MGGVGRTLMGGPAQGKNSSGNHAYDDVSEALTPALGYTTQGGNMMASLLGLNGEEAQTGGLEKFAESGGMSFMRDQGTRQINSSASARGLLKSGSTLKGLEKYGQGLGSTYLNSYMDKLMGLSNLGLGSANAMTAAGSWSKGKNEGAKEGILPMAAKAASAFSDPRLKTNIVEVGVLHDGLIVYDFDYIQNAPVSVPEGRYRGVMADEVALLRPESLGPLTGGYMTVSDPALFPRKVG